MKYLSRTIVSGVFLGLCVDEKDFKREIKRLGITDDVAFSEGSATTHTFWKRGMAKIAGTTCIVCIRKPRGRTRHEINGLLVHEAMHVWRATREAIGESSPSSEFEAYAMQSISQRLMEAYWCKSQRS